MTAEETARRYYQLFNERRLDEAAELVDRHAVYHYIPTGQQFRGPGGYQALMVGWLKAFDNARLDIQSVLVLSDEVVQVSFLGRGTHTGELVLGDAISIPATGRTAELPFQTLLEIRGGVIVSAELDFDVEEMKKRLAFG